MSEITLVIEDQYFKVEKDVLVEFSDYFRAMFSGNYVENEQKEIKISVVDAKSMKSIINYMQIGLIDLTDFSLAALGDLAVSASFLQISELIKQIELTLDEKLSLSNWIAVMTIAENSSLANLEKLAAAFGLFSFQFMKIEHIPSIEKLYWYLSHPYLDADSEVNVFNFGFQWVSKANKSADALLIVLGCLDVKTMTRQEFHAIQTNLKPFENSLVAKMVECLIQIDVKNWEMSSVVISENKQELCELVTERVYNEVLNLVRCSKSRETNLTPIVSMAVANEPKAELGPQYLYTFSKESGLEQWLEAAAKSVWGWSIAAWGLNKLIVVGGEHSRGTGTYLKHVAVWDSLRKEWTKHGVQLPPRRHAGMAVIGNLLYMIGGVGKFRLPYIPDYRITGERFNRRLIRTFIPWRVVQDTAVEYDLESRSYRKLVNLPDAIQNPPVCVHKGILYIGGHNNIYRYHDAGDKEMWWKVLITNIRAHYMVSLGDYIYVTQNYFNLLFRFKPGVDTILETCSSFSRPVAAMCSVGTSLIAFTQAAHGQNEALSVEEYKDGEIKTVWTEEDSKMRFNDVAGCCSLVMTIPPLHPMSSQYPIQYLKRFTEAHSETE